VCLRIYWLLVTAVFRTYGFRVRFIIGQKAVFGEPYTWYT